MAWVAALVAAAYSGYKTHNENRKAKQLNARNAALFANNRPDYIGNALAGRAGGNQYQQDLTALAQGTYFDKNALNVPLAQINQGAANNMQAIEGQLGRSNMSGGLANAYALANRTAQQGNVAGLFQNYGLWKEGQRRKDLDWLQGQQQQGIQNDQYNANQLANRYVQTQSPGLNALGAAWGTYAGSSGNNFFQGLTGSRKQGSTIQTGDNLMSPAKSYWQPNNNLNYWNPSDYQYGQS